MKTSALREWLRRERAGESRDRWARLMAGEVDGVLVSEWLADPPVFEACDMGVDAGTFSNMPGATVTAEAIEAAIRHMAELPRMRLAFVPEPRYVVPLWFRYGV